MFGQRLPGRCGQRVPSRCAARASGRLPIGARDLQHRSDQPQGALEELMVVVTATRLREQGAMCEVECR
jgi:hypothetical protein